MPLGAEMPDAEAAKAIETKATAMNSEMSRRGFLAAAAALPVAAQAAPGSGHVAPLKKGALGKYAGELAPGRYDAHTHVYPGEPDPDRLVKSFADAGLVGGVVFSRCPNAWQVPGS